MQNKNKKTNGKYKEAAKITKPSKLKINIH